MKKQTDIDALTKALLTTEGLFTKVLIPADAVLKAKFPWPESAPDISEFTFEFDERTSIMPESEFIDKIFLRGKLVAEHISTVYGESEFANHEYERVAFHFPKNSRVRAWHQEHGKADTLTQEGYKMLVYLITDELRDHRLKKLCESIIAQGKELKG